MAPPSPSVTPPQPRTRNGRLTAIRSVYRYASRLHPEHAATIERVLAIPAKRYERPVITFLTKPEINALIDAPDSTAWTGRRDNTMLMLATHARTEEQALARTAPLNGKPGRYKPPDSLLAFLEAL